MRSNKMEQTNWNPKTELGRKVLNKEITDIDEILDNGMVVLEEQIVDNLLSLDTDLLLVGQSKGKFGGGQRRVFRQTQKKTREGNKPRFTTMAVVGDKNGHIGIGYGKSKETVMARDKALRKAKLNVFKIRRGSGSWESRSPEPHSIPFAVKGKCGSVQVELMPAPKGTGLRVETECGKVLELAGVKDIWSRTFGQTKNKINLLKALEAALRKLSSTKVQSKYFNNLIIFEGAVKEKADIEPPKSTKTTSSNQSKKSKDKNKDNKKEDSKKKAESDKESSSKKKDEKKESPKTKKSDEDSSKDEKKKKETDSEEKNKSKKETKSKKSSKKKPTKKKKTKSKKSKDEDKK